MKCPVLVRDIPIYEDWLVDGRQVYKASTLDGFQEKLVSMLDGAERKNLSRVTEAGYEVAKSRSIASVGWQLAREYRRLTEQPPEPVNLEKKKTSHGWQKKLSPAPVLSFFNRIK